MAISDYARQKLNDGNLISVRDNWFNRLEEVRREKKPGHLIRVNGILGTARDVDLAYTDPESWLEECLGDLAKEVDSTISDIMFIPPCIEYGIYGVHFIDKLFGAELFFQDGQWYNNYLKTPIGELVLPDLDANHTWQLCKRVAEAFVAHKVSLPLFGLPTIASVLNIAVNLYGQEILVEMLINPENAYKDFKTINHLLCQLHSYYLSIIPMQQLQPVISWNRTQPPGYGQICGCTNQLVSGDTYRELIADMDNELLGIYPNGGMIHLCGSHLQHLETFRDMPNLKAIQVNDRAAHDLEAYFNGLREDQVIYLNPCEGMTVETAIEITKGYRLIIADTINDKILLAEK